MNNLKVLKTACVNFQFQSHNKSHTLAKYVNIKIVIKTWTYSPQSLIVVLWLSTITPSQ